MPKARRASRLNLGRGRSPHRMVVWSLLWISWVLAFATESHARAQDSTTVFTVCPPEYAPTSELAIPDGQGGGLVAWVDHRADPEGDIYVQRLDGAGRTVWAQGGVAACSAAGAQAAPVLAADGDGGAYLAWTDRRTGAPRVYVQHFGAAGIPRLEPDGRPITPDEAFQFSPMLTSDPQIGVCVVWLQRGELRAGLRGQLLDRADAPLWDSSGAVLDSTLTGEIVPGLLKLVTGGVLIGVRESFPRDRCLIQKVDHLASSVWPEPWVSPCDSCVPQEAVMEGDSNGNAFCVWSEQRSDGTGAIVAQRIGPDGGRLWGDGVEVASGSAPTERLQVSVGPGGVYVVWRQLGSLNPRITAQRLNPDGTIAWDPAGVKILLTGRGQDQPSFASDGAGGLVISCQAARIAEPVNIFCQRLRSSGELMWGDEGEPVATPYGVRSNPHTISSNDGASVVVWAQSDLQTRGLYATRISGAGFVGLQPAVRLQDVAYVWNPFPSPMTNEASIRFVTRTPMAADLSICDVTGRLVRTLVHEQLQPDAYVIPWDRRDDYGEVVAPGVYYVTLRTPLGSLSRKIVML